MFRGGQTNPYDEIVAKTTDENLTSENWELILNLCDKVQDEGEQGARNVIAALLKRLAHRNPNVQLYTLSLAESLTKNCGIQVHREIASRAFTQGLERIITDRNSHDKVKQRALVLIAMWTAEFEKDPTLGIMEECFENLKSKGYKFEPPDEAPPPDVDDEVRRREEEELQRALEMSMQDKGGRSQWSDYSLAAKRPGSSQPGSSSTSKPSQPSQPQPSTYAQQQQPTYGGYIPAANPSSADIPHTTSPAATATTLTQTPSSISYTASSPAPSTQSTKSESLPVVTRVKALHTFEPTEAGELGFEKGDIIKVVDRGYKDWWRGQLKGKTGIFPVNYVEPLPEPTAAELAREAEQEAAVFNQAVNVDRLLTMLRQLDPAKDNLADNEEIQELYRSCMSLRPKIVKLIDKYTQKRADLVSMNESFVKARTIFDRMMEDSLARHSGIYDSRPPYAAPYPPGRPESRARQDYGGPQAFGWNPAVYDQPGYNAYPAPYPGPAPAPGPGPEPSFPGGPQPGVYGVPEPYPPQPIYAHTPQPGPGQPQYAGTPVGPGPGPQPGPGYGPVPNAEPQGYPAQIQAPLTPQPVGPGAQPPHSISPHLEPTPTHQGLGGYGGVPPGRKQSQPQVQQAQASLPGQAQGQLNTQPGAQYQDALSGQSQPQQQPVQAQPVVQPQVQAQPQPQAQAPSAQQPQPQQQSPQQRPQSGPPYIFDPASTYDDPNVQAWAQYYAHGGTDPTGSVYFISVPGIKEGPKTAPPSSSATQDINATVTGSQQPDQQQQQQPQQQSPQQAYQVTAIAPLQRADGTYAPAEAHTQAPSSPSQRQSFYQPSHTPTQPTVISRSPVQQHQPTPYGSSTYPAQGAPPPAGAPPQGGEQQQQAWRSQYYNIPDQFANLSVGAEGHPQGPQAQGPGPQVGVPT